MSFFGRTRTYLDYASATPLCAESARAMADASRYLGNPGAIHKEGVAAAQALERARGSVARFLSCKGREIIFTSGATEANNLAILGYARKLSLVRHGLAGTRWLVASIEHPSVLEPFMEIERMGGEVVHIDPNEGGIVAPESVAQKLTKETVFVSVGWANGEIGTVQPLARIARVIHEYEKKEGTTILFHADAGQAPLYERTTVHSLGVDMLVLDSAKLYGPHGIGALYLNDRAQLSAVLFGGSQERGLRPGTENVALTLGFAAALAHIERVREEETKRLKSLRQEFVRLIETKIPNAVLNGDVTRSLPHILNISVPDMQSEYVTLRLDHEGFAISTKSACREGEERESHVVRALGGEAWRAQNTLRVSLGEHTRLRDIGHFVEALVSVLPR